jgi:hypothetical protein
VAFAGGSCDLAFQQPGQEFFAVIPAGLSDKRSRHLAHSGRDPARQEGEEKDGTSQIDVGRAIEGSSRSTSKQADAAAAQERATGSGRMAWKTGQKTASEKGHVT